MTRRGRNQPTAIHEPTLDQQYLQTGFREIRAQDQPVLSSANDDAVKLIGHGPHMVRLVVRSGSR
jgi:hypothetical protein